MHDLTKAVSEPNEMPVGAKQGAAVSAWLNATDPDFVGGLALLDAAANLLESSGVAPTVLVRAWCLFVASLWLCVAPTVLVRGWCLFVASLLVGVALGPRLMPRRCPLGA